MNVGYPNPQDSPRFPDNMDFDPLNLCNLCLFGQPGGAEKLRSTWRQTENPKDVGSGRSPKKRNLWSQNFGFTDNSTGYYTCNILQYQYCWDSPHTYLQYQSQPRRRLFFDKASSTALGTAVPCLWPSGATAQHHSMSSELDFQPSKWLWFKVIDSRFQDNHVKEKK